MKNGNRHRRSRCSRREFCLQAAGAAFAAALFPGGRPFPAARTARAAEEAPVLSAVEGPAGAAARRAVDLLGGMKRFVSRGSRVVVKPNIGWDRTPEQAANTSPEVVAEVVRMSLEAGAGQVRVFDRSCNDPRLCYRRSGIEDAVKGVGDKRARIFIPDRRKYASLAIRGGASLQEWPFYEDAVGADVFINVPVAKHHSLSGLTLAMKNVMGVIGGDRSQIHTGFDDKIIDLNIARPTHLTVIDATRVLVAHGPQGGRLADVRHPGVVVAGTDIVASDAYATRFFDLKPADIDHIRLAAQRGLGSMEPEKLSLMEVSL